MKKLIFLVVLACASGAPQGAPNSEVAGWEEQARNVTIIRDD